MMSRICVLVMVLLVLVLLNIRESTAADRKDADYLFTGMQKHRGELKRGIFRVKGVKKSYNQEQTRGSTMTFTSYCAFTDSLSHFRYDEEFKDTYGVVGLQKKRSDLVRYIRTPDRSIHVPERNAIAIAILPPEAQVRGGDITPFDPCVLGLVSDVELKDGIANNSFAMSFDSVFKSFTEKHVVEEVLEESETLHQIVFRFGPENSLQKKLWIDTSQGFAPVRMETYRPTGDGELSKEPVVVTTAKWKQISDVWVPVQAEMESHFNFGQMSVELQWDQVNGQVPGKLFTIEGFGLPETVMWTPVGEDEAVEVRPEIVDYRHDPEVVLQRQEFIEPKESD